MSLCLSIDVEDWYDGMSKLGHAVDVHDRAAGDLTRLQPVLRSRPDARITCFVVAEHTAARRDELVALAADGHEIASHGRDHGWMPADQSDLVSWLRSSRESIEDVVQTAVTGFRSPRFEWPLAIGLAAYRDALAHAGFAYVSDRHHLGAASAIRELPVWHLGRLPIGGGSYQRVLPTSVVSRLAKRAQSPTVCYYHSYDFDGSLPSMRDVGSSRTAAATQIVARRRIRGIFGSLLTEYGSESCRDLAR